MPVDEGRRKQAFLDEALMAVEVGSHRLEETGALAGPVWVVGAHAAWGLSAPLVLWAGARAGLVAVDAKTIEYVKGRPMAPGTRNGRGWWGCL